MGYARLSFAAALCLLIEATPASAAGAALMLPADAIAAGAAAGPRISVHFRRTQSYYCHPRNYWWFYRPYTTVLDGHARCMPYFHYLEPYGRRGGKPDRYVK